MSIAYKTQKRYQKQKGFSIALEPQRGNDSHFIVYICIDEYEEENGVFFMEDAKASYPSHIVNGLRQVFNKAGFTSPILNLL